MEASWTKPYTDHTRRIRVIPLPPRPPYIFMLRCLGTIMFRKSPARNQLPFITAILQLSNCNRELFGFCFIPNVFFCYESVLGVVCFTNMLCTVVWKWVTSRSARCETSEWREPIHAPAQVSLVRFKFQHKITTHIKKLCFAVEFIWVYDY